MDNTDWYTIAKQRQIVINLLQGSLEKFVEKNFTGGPKSSREDYSQMVSCKDIYDLREVLKLVKGD